MNVRTAILKVLREADSRGCTVDTMTPHVQAMALGDAWSRREIEGNLPQLEDQGSIGHRIDKLAGGRRWYITEDGKTLLAQFGE